MRPRISRTHLYKRVGPSVGPSVCRSIRHAFVKIAENGMMQEDDAFDVVYTALLNRMNWVHGNKADDAPWLVYE